jgi:MFS family permease
MIVCWAVASPLAGHFSDALGRRKPIYLGGAVVAAMGWTTMFYVPLPLAGFTIAAAITSFACGAVVVAFAFAKESVPVRFLGTISGAVNVGNMLGPTLLQPAIGWVLDRRWSGGLAAGVRVYPVDAFQTAFALIVVWSVLSCLFIALTRDSVCRQTA